MKVWRIIFFVLCFNMAVLIISSTNIFQSEIPYESSLVGTAEGSVEGTYAQDEVTDPEIDFGVSTIQALATVSEWVVGVITPGPTIEKLLGGSSNDVAANIATGINVICLALWGVFIGQFIKGQAFGGGV